MINLLAMLIDGRRPARLVDCPTSISNGWLSIGGSDGHQPADHGLVDMFAPSFSLSQKEKVKKVLYIIGGNPSLKIPMLGRWPPWGPLCPHQAVDHYEALKLYARSSTIMRSSPTMRLSTILNHENIIEMDGNHATIIMDTTTAG